MKYRYLYILLLFLGFSCTDDLDFPQNNRSGYRAGNAPQTNRRSSDPTVPKGRTVIVYLAGDNSLSKEVADIHAALVEGWNFRTEGSLVIFADQNNSSPVLMKMGKRNNVNSTDTLRRYINENSASPALLREVIADTKRLVPGESYGLILFSHATGWLPAKAFNNPAKWRPSSKSTSPIVSYSVFEDRGREMELVDFADALPDGMFDFIASEMCFMSSVETGYALRNKTDYLLAAAPEVLSPGFTPIYKTSLDLLFKPEPDLVGFAQAFFDYFNSQQGAHKSAAISLVRTSEMEPLATLTREIAPALSQQEIDEVQYYDRQGKPHVFFDFGDYIKKNATTEQVSQIDELLDKAVIFKLNTPRLINIDINKHSGLSVYIPQENLPYLNKAYEEMEWYKAIAN